MKSKKTFFGWECKGLSFIIVEEKIETSTETPNTDAASNLGGVNIDN